MEIRPKCEESFLSLESAGSEPRSGCQGENIDDTCVIFYFIYFIQIDILIFLYKCINVGIGGGWSNGYVGNGIFTLPDSDSDSDSDLDSKAYGYIVLCRACFHLLRLRNRSLSYSICIVQESVSKFESESESGNRNKP